MVNQALARKYFRGDDPVGKRIRFDDTEEDWMTIVGLVADSRNKGLDEEPEPLLYVPYHFFTIPFMTIVARTSAGPGAVASAVREEMRALDPELPLDAVKPMRQVIADRTAGPRFRTVLVAGFAVMALAGDRRRLRARQLLGRAAHASSASAWRSARIPGR
jgi:putative ABC transport system permease protein